MSGVYWTLYFSALLVFGISCGGLAEASTKVEPLSVNVYADLPDYDMPQLSPSGKLIAYFIADKGRRTLVVQSLDGKDLVSLPPTRDRTEFESFYWKSDEFLVFTVYRSEKRFSFRNRSDETRTKSLHLPSQTVKRLARPKPVPTRDNWRLRLRLSDRPAMFYRGLVNSQHERVVDWLIDEPEHILLQADFDLNSYPTVFKVNLKTGLRARERREKVGVQWWFTDKSSEVRMGVGYKRRSAYKNFFIKTNAGQWTNFGNREWLKTYSILAVGDKTNQVYVSGLNSHGTLGLFLLDIIRGEVIREVYSHPRVDIQDVITDQATGKLIGVSYIEDFQETKYFDKAYAAVQETVSIGFSTLAVKANVSIVNKARDTELYLVRLSTDTNPGTYYLYDRERDSLALFADIRRLLPKTSGSPTKSINIPMRDGNSIPAYLTVPKGEQYGPLPMVVLPHDGPSLRDTAEWDYQAQYYASLGYLVLRPNYRGSIGYGLAFQRAGENQYGGLMQDDVTDATRWMISEKIADPDRTCIIGTSYGGYMALMAAIQEPDLYRCAASINGMTNLLTLKAYKQRYVGGRDITGKMRLEGFPDKLISPYHQREKITIPVLFVAAKYDASIPFRDAKRLHKKLLASGKQSTLVELDKAAHDLLTASSRLAMLEATGEFLRKHISANKVRTAPPGKTDDR